MEASLLVQKLSERGIRLGVAGGKLTCDSEQPIPKAIMTTINTEKKQLVAFLKGATNSNQQAVVKAADDDKGRYHPPPAKGHTEKPALHPAPTADSVPKLPCQLEALLRAAGSDVLPKGMQHVQGLGLIPELSTYTLACAAVYLTGDRDEALRRLWHVHRTWQGVN